MQPIIYNKDNKTYFHPHRHGNINQTKDIEMKTYKIFLTEVRYGKKVKIVDSEGFYCPRCFRVIHKTN